MGGGNPISVAANFRLAFDTRSATRTATKYDAAMSNMVANGAKQMEKADRAAKTAYKNTMKELETANTAAEQRFAKNSKRTIAQIQQDQQKAYTAAQKGVMARQHPKSGSYKKAAAEYRAAMVAMRQVNKQYAAEMKKYGIQAMSGNKFAAQTFGQNTPQQRKRAINHMRNMIQLGKFQGHQLKAANNIKRTMQKIDEQLIQLEKSKAYILASNSKKAQMAARILNQELQKNRINFKMMKQAAQEVNMQLNQMASQITMGLTQALMTSTMLMVGLGFQVSKLASEFQEFEQELRNANSIWQTTNDVLYEASDTILKFGTNYGITLQDATEGLYQMASAGLSANESQEMLQATLRLSMAVQGDHEALAKLTIQVLKGFGKEMSEAAAETDKMAYAINKSLIQWEDLASGVKFAMPFFVSMNQETEQLYGALEVLADRALEAGISGRGLRQALAQFAKHAEDNTAAFNKMGIATQDANGEFLQLTEIASNFAEAFGDSYTDAEMMTQLLEDFNVRGATAFVHLVQNAEEFNFRVNDLVNSTGAAKEMADKQNESIKNQVQIMKNAFKATLFASDATYEHLGAMNELDYLLKVLVTDFRDFMFIQTETGLILSKNGETIKNLIIGALKEFILLFRVLYKAFQRMNPTTEEFVGIMHALTLPLKIVAEVFALLGKGTFEAVIMFKMLNSIIPQNTIFTLMQAQAQMTAMGVDQARIGTMMQLGAAIGAVNMAMFAGLLLMNKEAEGYQVLGKALVVAAGAAMGYSMAIALARDPAKVNVPYAVAAAAAGAAAMLAFTGVMKKTMIPPEMDYQPVDLSNLEAPVMDLGGMYIPTYDNGGVTSEHGLAMLQKGETVIPKTRNMLDGGGITLNIHGDVYDGDNFAQKISEVLPNALRMTDRTGGI
jgi:TP901 family phage tail tape measure protein